MNTLEKILVATDTSRDTVEIAEGVGALARFIDQHTGFPSGTRMLFRQTAAPPGWTKDASHHDKALRVVSGTAGDGGSVAFSRAFASQGINARSQPPSTGAFCRTG